MVEMRHTKVLQVSVFDPRFARLKQFLVSNFHSYFCRPLSHSQMASFVDSEILSANPKFQALHRDVLINKLDSDGTTRLDVKAQKELDTSRQVCANFHHNDASCDAKGHLLTPPITANS